MECMQQGCEKEAVAIAHWPGQETKQCEEHCRALDQLSKFMGGGGILFTSLGTGQIMAFRGNS